MNSGRWQRTKELLDQVLQLEASHRANFLDHACADDSELRREVESLLASHEQAGTAFLAEPAADLSARPQPRPQPLQGRRIGVYQVVEEIGRGGMGEVYRAVRADGQYTKEVAIKLVRGGLDSRSVQERFLNERQILASLDHPNIARLLDGGTTDDGVPYLVMELIDGKPVDQYCDGQRLGITQRMQLFRQICAAVQFAHQRLVIHRDIKPSNILVTKEGVPKLLDFGIAKLVEPQQGTQITMTQAMTPEYASPEQIKGESITTATDVYSLGVVLYQLLTGHSPYPGDTSSPLKLARAVCDTDPKPPSAMIAAGEADDGNQAQADTPSLASRLGEKGETKLHRRLAGDVDNIVLMALRKEPARRYASVEQFTEDIRRHLEGLPVLATKGSWSYRARKFVVRNKAAAAGTAAAILALAVGLALALREAKIARQQAEIARVQKARAEKRFDDVRQLSDSLIFEVHDAIQNLPGATPARKLLLDRALEYLDSVSKDAAGDPDLQRELAWGYQRIAVVQGNNSESNLGDPDAAIASDRKSLALFEAVAKANPDNTIDQLNVAMMHRILSFSSLGTAAGRDDLKQAMDITEWLLRRDPGNPKIISERSIEYQNLGFSHDAMGDRPGGLDAYRKYYEMRREILRTTPQYHGIRRSVGVSTVLLGSALARMGSRDEALKLVEEGIGFLESEPKGRDEINTRRDVAIARQTRTDILLMNGNAAGALASYREIGNVLGPMAKADPANSMLQFDMAGVAYNEGRALALLGNYRGAIESLQRAREIYEKPEAPKGAPGESVRGNSDVYIWIGDAYALQADHRRAIEFYQMATALLEKNKTPEPHDDDLCEQATALIKMAYSQLRLGEAKEAASTFQKSIVNLHGATAVKQQDVPALYEIAQAQSGAAEALTAQARNVSGEEQSGLLKLASEYRRQSAETWSHVPNPSRISPNGFLVEPPRPPR